MKSVAAILLALCLAHLHDVDASVKVLRKTSQITNDKKLQFFMQSYTDEYLTYALCDDKHLEADELNCTVIREKEPYGNDSYSCDVSLERRRSHDPKSMPPVLVYPFGQKYVALSVMEGKDFLYFTVVQMDNCEASEADGIFVGSDAKFLSLVPLVGHSDSFDVFYASAVFCGDKMCKATIGADGETIDKSISIQKYVRSDSVLSPVVALDNGSTGNGYFYLTTDGKDYIYVLVKPDGTEKILARRPKPAHPQFAPVSTKNNLLGLCYELDDKHECNQYDFDGNLKLNTTITSDDKNRTYMYIYNAPNGGFYVFSMERVRDESGTDFKGFSIERVDANGTKTGSIMFQGFDGRLGDRLMSPMFYENNAKEVCFSLASRTINNNHIEAIANCFTDSDFSK